MAIKCAPKSSKELNDMLADIASVIAFTEDQIAPLQERLAALRARQNELLLASQAVKGAK